MRKLVVAAVAVSAAVSVGCTPEIEQVASPEVVVARFDPSASPPVVPTPNDLATDRSTGLLKVTPAPGASKADEQFVAWLNTLNGFPASTSGGATFTGELDQASLGERSIRVFDVTGPLAPVTGTTFALAAPAFSDGEEAKSKLQVAAPAGGWKPGHTYAVALISGTDGLKSKGGQPLVGSATWSLIRSEKSLVTCQDLTSSDCRSTTEVLPSSETEPAARIKDQAAKAVQLEQLRLKYKPVIDALLADGVKREDIALAWSFRVHDGPIALFNPAATPPQVPLPNDLAIDPTTGLVNAPIDPSAPAAQQEFTRDYLNTLDGFPVTAGGDATVIGGALDPATVNAQTVQVIDLDLAPGASPVTPTISWKADTGHVVISPPQTGWEKGHRYAIALTTALKSDKGAALAAGDVWALARNSEPLVDCQTLTDPACKSVVTMAPISNAQAIALEGMRRGFKPVLDAFEQKGLQRKDLALLWTFKVVSFSEATFDPGNGVIPFPNDLLLKPGNPPQVQIPIPPNASPLQQQLMTGLNTLDGFSTTGPYVSENSKTLGALDHGRIKAASLAAGTGFVPLTPGVTPPLVSACLDCQSSLQPDGSPQDGPQQLQFVTQSPLDERSTYAAFLTDGLVNEEGKKVIAAPTFALIRMENPLIDANGKSQVNGVADADAAKLEPLRLGFKRLVDGLVAAGIQRKQLALAWAFTTQSAQSHLNMLHGVPDQLGKAGVLPNAPIFAADVTAMILPTLAVPKDHIGKIFAGTLYVPWLLTGPGTVLDPEHPAVRKAPFTLVLPQGTAPAAGWPVTIFGHGLGRNRNDMLAIANALTGAGHAVIAIDHVFHGDRSTCVGSKALTGASSDDGACADPAKQTCSTTSGRCVARNAADRLDCSAGATAGLPGDLFCTAQGQGMCATDSKCEGGDFRRDPATGEVLISSNAFLDTVNLFATRDHFRAPVADLAQLERILLDANANGGLNAMLQAQGAGKIDPGHITYAGQSLGGMIGTLFTSTSSSVERSLLNVPGADLAEILLTAEAFQSTRQGFLALLATQGITPGTPAFDEFIGMAKWILGPSDPQNAAYWMLNGMKAPMSRKVLLQYITRDTVIPNPTTETLLAAMNRDFGRTGSVYLFDPTTTRVPASSRHGFLLNFKDPATTATAQSQAAAFISTGVTP